MASRPSKRAAAEDSSNEDDGPPLQRQRRFPYLAIHEKVDVVDRLKFVMICCNRALGEMGVSRIIAGFHKDLLCDEILADMNRKFSEATANQSLAVISFDAIFYYMKNYVKIKSVYKLGLECCRAPLRHQIEAGYNAQTMFDGVMAGAFLHKDFDTQIALLQSLPHMLDLQVRTWRFPLNGGNHAPSAVLRMEQFLDRGGENILLQDLTAFDEYNNTSDWWGLIAHLDIRTSVLDNMRDVLAGGSLGNYAHLLPRINAVIEHDEHERQRIRQLVRPISPFDA